MSPAVADALDRGAWHEVVELVSGADDDPEALEAASIAYWWLDDADATIASRERAYRLYRERGDHRGAARIAGALAWDSVLFGGRVAVGQGWLDRAARLLRDEPLSPEHAWTAVRSAEVALAAGDPAAADAAAKQATAAARALDREDLLTVAQSLEGLALVHEGRVDEGMRRLDASAVAATAGEVRDLMWIGKVCCNLIAACERVGDVERATEWCAEVKEFASRWELRTLFNVCRTQYAAVLVRTGEWQDAEMELERALDAFTGGRRAALTDGTATLGELRRLQGRSDEARRLFDLSERSWTARVGRIELALDEGDPASALELAQTVERTTQGARQLDRVTVLGLVCRAAAAAGAPEEAAEAADELTALADEVATPRARAIAARAGGVLALASGDAERAREQLADAAELFALAQCPYERASVRLSLAAALSELGLHARSRSEEDAAMAAFASLGARRHGEDAVAENPLTPREREVLGLVAEGRSNRQIAERLVVSEHTVHRHVANILRKLGEPTRTAAAARATRDGLL
jgi:ATP/maltotriose-dependent transcriptional regulator MalT